ncbi:MAG: hypothetical protein WAN60_22870 [Candidatus Sulfotelmatobacter sp.]
MILPYIATAALLFATAYSAVVSFRQKTDGSASTWFFPGAAKRSSRIVVGICTIALSAGLAAWLTVGARNSTGRSSRFLIPDGYVGWVRVEFEVNGALPLPVENGESIFQVPPSGLLKTSSPEQYGWAKDRYYYYSTGGLRMLPDARQPGGSFIWGKINGEESGARGKTKYEEFFVGTGQQFREQSKGTLNIGSSVPRTSAK